LLLLLVLALLPDDLLLLLLLVPPRMQTPLQGKLLLRLLAHPALRPSPAAAASLTAHSAACWHQQAPFLDQQPETGATDGVWYSCVLLLLLLSYNLCWYQQRPVLMQQS
jgi:hypothetical protein